MKSGAVVMYGCFPVILFFPLKCCCCGRMQCRKCVLHENVLLSLGLQGSRCRTFLCFLTHIFGFYVSYTFACLNSCISPKLYLFMCSFLRGQYRLLLQPNLIYGHILQVPAYCVPSLHVALASMIHLFFASFPGYS